MSISRFSRRFLLCLLPAALFVAPALSRGDEMRPALTEDQKIVHAVNRLGFGPRPGDIERVMQIGLDNWIRQQLHP
jgi:hypothetical protein